MLSNKDRSERDICTKFITPALEASGWNKLSQVLKEVSFTDGKSYVKGKLTDRSYILYYKPNRPIAVIEAKNNKHMQQALYYAPPSHLLDRLKLEAQGEEVIGLVPMAFTIPSPVIGSCSFTMVPNCALPKPLEIACDFTLPLTSPIILLP